MQTKRWLLIALALLMALSVTACGAAGGQTPDAETSAALPDTVPAMETDAARETLPEPDEDTRLIASVPMTVELPEGYNAYDPDGNYTDEMCAAQGVEPENMAAYMSMAKKDLMLVPADERYADCSLEIYIRVKDDKDYGIENFSDLSETEFQKAADALAEGFASGGFEVFDSDAYETENARYCVIDCKAIDFERRYTTVVNGKMIYIVAVTKDDGVTEEQDALVRELLDTLRFG